MRRPPTRKQSKSPVQLVDLLAKPEYREIPLTILPHATAIPLGVMVHGTMEWMLDHQVLQTLFQDHAPEQYTRQLTISALVKLLIQVSAGSRASVFAAFVADQASPNPSINTSFQALYGKIGRFNPSVSEALVRHSAVKLEPLLKGMPPTAAEPISGYRMRVLDGNVLTGTDHRLSALRKWLNACLPGKSVVVYEPIAFTVVLRPRALADITNNADWLEATQGLRAATRWRDGLVSAAIPALEADPTCSPQADEAAEIGLDLRELLHGRRQRHVFRVMFTIDANTVSIHRIRHADQDRVTEGDI